MALGPSSRTVFNLIMECALITCIFDHWWHELKLEWWPWINWSMDINRHGTTPVRSGAGLGVGMLMVLWLYGFMVLWFYGFIVLWFYGFMALRFYGFMVLCFYVFTKLQNFHFMFSGIYRSKIHDFQEFIVKVFWSI